MNIPPRIINDRIVFFTNKGKQASKIKSVCFLPCYNSRECIHTIGIRHEHDHDLFWIDYVQYNDLNDRGYLKYVLDKARIYLTDHTCKLLNN